MSVIEIDFPGNLAQVDSIADLRLLPSSPIKDGEAYLAGGNGLFTFDSDLLSADDGKTIIKPSDITPLQAGRWVLSGSALFDPNLRLDLSGGSVAIGFKQVAAPAAPTTLQDEARFTVRPEQFAQPSDTSMAQAINRASVAVAANGGGTIDLRGADYPVDYPILLGNKVRLRGKGWRATRIVQTGSAASWSGLPGLGIISTDTSSSYDGIAVEGLTVAGLHAIPVPDGAPNYARLGIALGNVINSTVDRCLVRDTSTGIAIYGTVLGETVYGNRVTNCRTKNTKSWLMAGNSGTPRAINVSTPYSDVLDCVIETTHTGVYGASEFGKIRNVRVRDFFDDGFYINSNDMDVSNWRVSDGPGSGVALNPGQRNKISGGTAFRCLNAGIRFRHAGTLAPRYNSVTDNLFIECGYGVLDDMTGADANPANAVAAFNTISGNKAVRCNLSGFRFQRQSAATITDNQAIDNNQQGITADTRGGFSFVADCTTNKVANNICDDTQGTPTQAFGLYVYGNAGNVSNDVRHLSRLGVDLFMPMRQSGTVALTIASGTPANTTPTISFPMPFDGIPRVLANIQNADELADAERPVVPAARSVTSTSFRLVADGKTNMAANRNLTIAWFATVEST